MKNLANNFNRIREVNTDLVRSALKAAEAATKAGLAAATGLSVATCGNILTEMLARGEAMELELGVPEGGRPPRLYSYQPMFSLSALLFPKAEAGRKRLLFETVDARGKVVEKGEVQVERADLHALDELIEDLKGRYVNLKALAVSIPGLVRDGRVGFSDLPELDGTDVANHFRSRHNLQVSVENDVNLAALGFYDQFPERSGDSVAYLVVPHQNCTGAGLVVDGMLIRGHTCFAGELSFIPDAVSRDMQFAGLEPAAALAYVARMAAAIIPVFNPATLVVASELADDDALAMLRDFCRQRVPEEHLPTFVARRSLDEDCLAGLGFMALSSISGKVRLVEDERISKNINAV